MGLRTMGSNDSTPVIKYIIIGFIVIAFLVASYLIFGKEEYNTNREIVYNFVQDTQEKTDAEKEVYKALVDIISEYNSGSEIASESTEETLIETENIAEETSEIRQVSAWHSGTKSFEGIKSELPSVLQSMDLKLDAGVYVTPYDIPAGKYMIALDTPNHQINCMTMQDHNRIQPGNADYTYQKDGIYRYTLELPENTIVQLGSTTYLQKLDRDSVVMYDNTDMSGTYFENLSATDLYLLAYAGKKPDVRVVGKVLKVYSNGYAIMNGNDIISVLTDNKEYTEGDEVEFIGTLTRTFETGNIKSGVITDENAEEVLE